MNLVTPKAGAKHEFLFNEPATGVVKFKTKHCGEFGHTVMFKYDLNIQKISGRDK